MAAAQQLVDLFVRKVIHKIQQLRIFREEMFAGIAARLDGILLVIAIDHLLHAAQEQTSVIGSQEFIPIRSPDDLDNIPAGSLENSFQFLDDLAVAAHWS